MVKELHVTQIMFCNTVLRHRRRDGKPRPAAPKAYSLICREQPTYATTAVPGAFALQEAAARRGRRGLELTLCAVFTFRFAAAIAQGAPALPKAAGAGDEGMEPTMCLKTRNAAVSSTC
jgi:hypothetical protein